MSRQAEASLPLEELKALARKRCVDLNDKAKAQGRWHTLGVTLHYVLGFAVLGLSAIAGAGFLTEELGATTAGWLAVATSLITAVYGFVAPDARAERAKSKQRAYAQIARRIEVRSTFWGSDTDPKEIEAQLQVFEDERAAVEATPRTVAGVQVG